MRRVLGSREGLTLVELLIALVVLGVILGGMFAATKAMVHAWAAGQHRVGVQQNGRNAIDWATRRIRMAGIGWDVTYGPIYTAAESQRIGFRADLGQGLCQYEYLREGTQLVERVYDDDHPRTAGRCGVPQDQRRRILTAAEEVGIITVADLNFCYYGILNQLLNGPQEPATGRCSGQVAASDLGSVYRVQMRLTLVSGRPGEDPVTLYSQAFVRAQEMP